MRSRPKKPWSVISRSHDPMVRLSLKENVSSASFLCWLYLLGVYSIEDLLKMMMMLTTMLAMMPTTKMILAFHT